MAARPISSKLHGILDYSTGAALTALPSVLGLGGTRAGRTLRIAGATTAGYSLVTNYELGARKALPYRGHLALDAVAAAGLAAAPFLLRTRDEGVRHWLPHVVLGALELGVVALSDPSGAGATASPPAAATTPAGTGATPPREPQPQNPETKDRPPVVMPDGVEANAAMGARTIGVGTSPNGGGIGSGTAEPGSPNAGS